jgi:myo-inositol-1(or 4)-monophosphatase
MVLEQRDLSQILEVAVVAARLAGQHAMEEINYVKAVEKSEAELVTQADAQCQQIIVQRIKETYPDHGFIGEEGEQGKIFKRAPRGDPALWWVIDPIDGTHNFAHGMPIFTVSIAAMFQGEPIVGVIFEPATESMFTAVKDGEAQLNGRHILAGDEGISPFTSVGLDSHFDDPLPPWVCEIIKQSRFRNLGTTALQLAYVAKGGLVATVACTPKLWDIAAGAAIVEAAGAVVTNWQGEKVFPVNLDHYEGQASQVLAGNKKVHPKLVELIKVEWPHYRGSAT